MPMPLQDWQRSFLQHRWSQRVVSLPVRGPVVALNDFCILELLEQNFLADFCSNVLYHFPLSTTLEIKG